MPSRSATTTTARCTPARNANRPFHWTGTNGPTGANVAYGEQRQCLEPDSARRPKATNGRPTPSGCRRPNVSWKVYQNIPNNYGCNPLLGFKPYRKANEASGKPVSTSLPRGASPAYAPGDDVGNPLYKGTATTLPVADQAAFDAGAIMDAFRADVEERPAAAGVVGDSARHVLRAPRPLEPRAGRAGTSSRCWTRSPPCPRCGARRCSS